MADKENIRDRIRRVNPRALPILDLLDNNLRELGGTPSACVTLTEDMTREEQLMALIEGNLKEGYSWKRRRKKPRPILPSSKVFKTKKRPCMSVALSKLPPLP